MHFPSLPWSAQYISIQQHEQYASATFGEKIVAIDCKIGKWTHPTALLQSKDFVAIYHHPTYYYPYILEVLDSFWFTTDQKKIAAYGMEQLPCADHLQLVAKVEQLYQAGKLQVAVLDIILGKNSHILTPPCSLAETLDKVIALEKEQQQTLYPNIDRLHWNKYPNCPEFVAIYTHPDCYVEEAIVMLKNRRCTPLYGAMLLETMGNLGAVSHAQFLAAWVDGCLQGRLPMGLLRWATHERRSCLPNRYAASNQGQQVNDYNHPMVQTIFGQLLSHPRLPAYFKIGLIHLQSGQKKHKQQGIVEPTLLFHEETTTNSRLK